MADAHDADFQALSSQPGVVALGPLRCLAEALQMLQGFASLLRDKRG